VSCSPRFEWRARVEQDGLTFHDGYWDESAFYAFSAGEIDALEKATNDLHALCLEAVQHVIDRDRFAELRIPPHAAELVRLTWEAEPPAIYGRFDLAFDGRSPPKLLEYNADTPTALLEAAVIQWRWLEDTAPEKDQFNSIHERLIAGWKELKPYLPGEVLHFVSQGTDEDRLTAAYVEDCAAQAGLATARLAVEEIGWDPDQQRFCDLQMRTLRNVFKLYPWEWMVREQFGVHLLPSVRKTLWIEPAWKMVLSNKGLLPILWELSPGHPNLLEAHFEPGRLRSFAQKPLYSREGANVRLVRDGSEIARGPDEAYGEEGFVYQALVPGPFPVIGSWVIQGEAAGIGLRESDELITGNKSRFVPHLID
jgi:glutathionylspermidine synthase